jgi:hypothetical protein
MSMCVMLFADPSKNAPSGTVVDVGIIPRRDALGEEMKGLKNNLGVFPVDEESWDFNMAAQGGIKGESVVDVMSLSRGARSVGS